GRREGKRVFYRLAGDEAGIGLLAALSRVGERNSAEIARGMASYFRARDELGPVSRTEVLERPRGGTAIVLDVRPEDEFRQGHLPGALNIPLRQLERRLADLPPDREIVACCRRRGASSPSRRSPCCATEVIRCAGSKTASRNGKW